MLAWFWFYQICAAHQLTNAGVCMLNKRMVSGIHSINICSIRAELFATEYTANISHGVGESFVAITVLEMMLEIISAF